MESVGDFLKTAKSRAISSFLQFLGIIVYLGMLLWTGIHNYNLLTNGVPDGMLLWALIGVVALEANAIALPLALHHWTFAAEHRLAAFLFYILDLALLFLNVALDYGLVAGSQAAPEWLALYHQWVVPATPIVAGITWGVLWALDPHAKQRVITEELRASTQETLARRMADAAKSVDIENMVQQAAQALVRDVVSQSLGTFLQLPAPHPHPTPHTAARPTASPRNSNHRHPVPTAAVDPTQPPGTADS